MNPNGPTPSWECYLGPIDGRLSTRTTLVEGPGRDVPHGLDLERGFIKSLTEMLEDLLDPFDGGLGDEVVRVQPEMQDAVPLGGAVDAADRLLDDPVSEEGLYQVSGHSLEPEQEE